MTATSFNLAWELIGLQVEADIITRYRSEDDAKAIIRARYVPRKKMGMLAYADQRERDAGS